MSVYKPGTRVRLIEHVGGDAEVGDLGTVIQHYSDGTPEYLVKFDGRVQGGDDNGRHYVSSDELELAVESPKSGDTVRVAYEATIDHVGDAGFLYLKVDTDGYRHVLPPHSNRVVEILKPAKTETIPGRLYRDANGGLFLRRGVSDAGFLTIRPDGSHGYAYAGSVDYPVEPLTEVLTA